MKLVKTIAHVSDLPELFVFYCARCKQAETKVLERTAVWAESGCSSDQTRLGGF